MHKLGLSKLIKNSVGTLVRQLGAGVLQLLTVIVIARVLGPEGNGQFAIALLLPTMLYRFLEMGLPTANAHFIGSGKVSVRTAFNTSLQWSTFLIPLGLTLGALSIWLAASQWFPGVPPFALWLALSVYPALLLQTFLASIFQGLQDFKAYNLVLLLQPAITLLLSLVLVAMGEGTTTGLIASYLVGVVITLVVSYGTLRRHFDGHSGGQSGNHSDGASSAARVARTSFKESFKESVRTGSFRVGSARAAVKEYSQNILRYALKSHISIALAFFNYRVDVYLLNLLGNTADTGVYVIATQMVEKLWLLSGAVSIVMLPLISQLASEEDRRKRITPLLCLWVSVLTGLAAVVTGLFAVPIVGILFGSSYALAAVIIQILLPGIVAWSGARVLAQDITARGKPELNIYMNGGVLLVNVIGNLLLIPRYGSQGAAIATTLAYCLFAVQMLFFHTRMVKPNWRGAIADSLEFGKQKLKVLVR